MADSDPPTQPAHRHVPGDPWSLDVGFEDVGGGALWNGGLASGFDPFAPLVPAGGWAPLTNWVFAPGARPAAPMVDAALSEGVTALPIMPVACDPVTSPTPVFVPSDAAITPEILAMSDMSLNSGVVLSDGGTGALTNTVTATSSAAAAMNVPATHVFNGVTLTGAGIKIGILSDSFENKGTAAVAADISAGNLPAGGVTDVKDLLNGAGTDEGRAMAQLIYQVAPGAQMYFYSGLNSEADFAAGIGSLVALGCNVIVDDVTYLDEPFYQDGSAIDVAIENAVSAGVSYFTSAGNAGKDYYEHTWVASTTTISGVSGTPYNFGTSGTPNDFESITTVAAGGKISLDLQWAQPFAINSNVGTDDELTMYLFNSGGTLLATSFTPAGDTGDPDMQLAYTNTGTAAANYQLAIVNTSGSASGLFKVIDYGAGTITGGTGGAGVGSGTVIGHEMLPTANSIGASNYSGGTIFHNGTAQFGVESFSAYGPGEFLFNSSGSLLSQATTLAKVNFNGTDGSTTSVVLNGSNNTFSGTSAAAPDAAAVAALMLQADPSLTPAQITADLTSSATAISSGPGVSKPNNTGTGVVNALGAVTLAQQAAACYIRGTRIETDRGPAPIEALTTGDRVLTLDGPQPVRWTGSCRIDLLRHACPELARPIRIRRNAIADDVPYRDVLVSPDHALYFGGRLIIARLLINGASILPDHHATSVEYHHIEFDRHAVIFANGLPAESYLDTGNRALFSNGTLQTLHPDFSTRAAPKSWQHDACAPLTDDPAHVRPIWQQLADRAGDLGLPLPHIDSTTEPALRIVVDGRTILPVTKIAGRYTFMLPPQYQAARINSRANAPSDVHPWIEDRRRLGVCISRIRLTTDNETHDIPVDHPDLAEGWWDPEHVGGQQWRWTNGDALLPLRGTTGHLLELQLVGGMTYRLEAARPRQRAA